MTALRKRVQNGLDEHRMLVLGIQVLIGFGFEVVLQEGFDRIARPWQLAKLVSLTLFLLTLGLLFMPSAHHRLVERGQDTRRFHRLTTLAAAAALLPFALALGLDMSIALTRVVSTPAAVAAGATVGGVALAMWYGVELVARERVPRPAPSEDDMQEKPTDLDEKIRHALTECRVVLPGAQALLGFQLAAMFMDAFDRLPESSKLVHVVSLSMVMLSTVLLMTPAAWHRIVEGGENSERFHRLASAMLLGALVPLALGVCGDYYVVLARVLGPGSGPASAALAVAMLATFATLWFGSALLRKGTRSGSDREVAVV